MAKTATMNIRMEPELKKSVEALYSSFGITVTDAVNLFFHQSLIERGLPFAVQQARYNAETEAAIQEARDIQAGKIKKKSYANFQEFLDDLED